MVIKELVLMDVVIPVFQNKNLVLIKDIILIVSLTILTALCAGLKIQIGLVPITLQTFSVLLAGILLGSRRGAISQIIYVVAGLTGIPWFSMVAVCNMFFRRHLAIFWGLFLPHMQWDYSLNVVGTGEWSERLRR